MCKHGVVIEKDEAMASKFFTEAAESGLAAAQLYAGRQSLFGSSEEADYFKAFEWFLKAGEQGLPMAQEAVGAMLNSGIGVELNRTKAFEWFLRAADQNLDTSQFCVGEAYYQGEAPPSLNPDCFEFVSHLEYLGSPAHYRLGPSLPKRRQMHVSLRKAFHYFSLSAEQKNTMAMRRLGEMLRYGEGVPRDKEKSEYWLNRAEKLDKRKKRS
jgi:TPR repeat protein